MWKETNIIEAHTLQNIFFGVNGITWLGFMILEPCMCFACLEKGLMVIEIKFLC
jgi:hypothetical protein